MKSYLNGIVILSVFDLVFLTGFVLPVKNLILISHVLFSTKMKQNFMINMEFHMQTFL